MCSGFGVRMNVPCRQKQRMNWYTPFAANRPPQAAKLVSRLLVSALLVQAWAACSRAPNGATGRFDDSTRNAARVGAMRQPAPSGSPIPQQVPDAQAPNGAPSTAPDAGLPAGNNSEAQSGATADPNPHHLEAKILNPFDSVASVSSPPPNHHQTVNFEEEFSFDLVRNLGSVGKDVWFKAEAMAPATAVRGRVLQGGKHAQRPLCKSNVWAHGGGGLQIGVEVLHAGTWTAIGWVLYGHVQDMTVNDGDLLESPTKIAKVTGLKDMIACSTGGHIHMGLKNTIRYPCWVTDRQITEDGVIGQLGGERSRLSKAEPPASIASCAARLKGDANGDGQIDAEDAAVTEQFSKGFAPKPFYADSADVDCNGKADLADARWIARYVSGLEHEFCPYSP